MLCRTVTALTAANAAIQLQRYSNATMPDRHHARFDIYERLPALALGVVHPHASSCAARANKINCGASRGSGRESGSSEEAGGFDLAAIAMQSGGALDVDALRLLLELIDVAAAMASSSCPFTAAFVWQALAEFKTGRFGTNSVESPSVYNKLFLLLLVFKSFIVAARFSRQLATVRRLPRGGSEQAASVFTPSSHL